MDPIFITTLSDKIADMVGAAFYLFAFYQSIKYLWLNNISAAGKVIYVVAATIALLHVVQNAILLYVGGPTELSVTLWNPINYLMVFFVLLVVERTHRRERHV